MRFFVSSNVFLKLVCNRARILEAATLPVYDFSIVIKLLTLK